MLFMRANKFGEFSGDQDADNLDDADPTDEVMREVRQFIDMAAVAATNCDWDKARQAIVDARLLFEDLIGREQ